MSITGGLDLADFLAVRKLKYVRQRSMRNPHWRDYEHLGRLIKRGYLRWDLDSPLEEQRLSVERALAGYRLTVKRRTLDGDERWAEVRAAVDQLIAEGERIAGKRIKPRSM